MHRKMSHQLIMNLAILLIVARLAVFGFQTFNDVKEVWDVKKGVITQSLATLGDMDQIKPLSAEELERHLIVLHNAFAFNIYKVDKKTESGETLAFQSSGITQLATEDLVPGVFYTSDQLIIKKQELTNFVVTVGLRTSIPSVIKNVVLDYGHYILMDIALLALVIFIIVRFRLEVLGTISRTLAKVTPRDLQDISHSSVEIRTIVAFLKSFIDQYTRAESQKAIYRRNLADGIMLELFTSKKKPPYSLTAIVVRFDMNNYTRRALQENPGALTTLLSVYFRRVKELRTRYGGLDYQFIGDEKVLFFKVDNGDQYESQMLRAVAFLRDAFLIAKEMSSDIPLTFKAALVPGTLVFYELDGAHYFTGNPLIESARYLTTISEKDRSILSAPTACNEKIKSLCRPFHSETVLLKGYESPFDISYYDSFENKFSPDKDPMLFLSDEGLVHILESLTELLIAKDIDKLLLVFLRVRSVRTDSVNNEVVGAYEKLLVQAVESFKAVNHDNRVLSSMIALCWVFVPCGQENSRLKEIFYTLIRHADVRVASNALMASQRYEWNEEVISKMLASPSNRLRGDALLLLGRRGVDEKFYELWKSLVESKDPLFVLSGLWASQEVFKFHGENNPTHLKSNPLVENMSLTIGKLKKAAHRQVSQRAQWALEALDI